MLFFNSVWTEGIKNPIYLSSVIVIIPENNSIIADIHMIFFG